MKWQDGDVIGGARSAGVLSAWMNREHDSLELEQALKAELSLSGSRRRHRREATAQLLPVPSGAEPRGGRLEAA